jgi:hypothetical protein
MLRLLVWLVILAALVYLTFWVIDRRVDGGDDAEPRRPRTPMAPWWGRGGRADDDDFLRELERRRRSNDG